MTKLMHLLLAAGLLLALAPVTTRAAPPGPGSPTPTPQPASGGLPNYVLMPMPNFEYQHLNNCGPCTTMMVMSVLGVLFWLLLLVSSLVAATQPVPAGYLQSSGLTVEEYRSIARAGWIFGMAFSAIGLAANTFVLVVLIRKGREFA